MKTGLVLEGGAMRGLFSAGVMDVLMENNITFSGAVGVSAGACFGCNYKSGQNGRVIRYNLRFSRDKRYCSTRSLITTGDMFGAEFCYHTIPDELDIFDSQAFEKSPMEFFSVATDIETGRAVYHRMNKATRQELEWLRASASMPLFARIVELDGRKMLDGGIADSIPLRFMESMGYEKNLVILTQPRSYSKKPSSILPLIKARYRKYPEFVSAFEKRPAMYNNELKYIRRAESEGRALVIAPPEKLPIGHIEHNQDKLLEVYRIGRNTARQQIDRIARFLDGNTL
ncbi:MAG: patatin family protein [Ruminococcus flavefaciens]|nr:patatin family protein [Ruminococcus flavefaciens]MCM1229751.1 patatin family protein [Ruminococcus flavefaciens]